MKGLLKGQEGFTLAEVLVAMVMMLTVMFALYSIFDMSLRVFSFGNDKVEAVENARIGVERMEREIRAAYPQEDGELLTVYEDETIAFGNDLNGDRQIECPNSEGELCEEISYEVYTTSGGPQALGRANTASGINRAVVEYVEDLSFEYLKLGEDGAEIETDSEEEIQIVRVSLTIDVDGRDQTLQTDIALRNRSG